MALGKEKVSHPCCRGWRPSIWCPLLAVPAGGGESEPGGGGCYLWPGPEARGCPTSSTREDSGHTRAAVVDAALDSGLPPTPAPSPGYRSSCRHCGGTAVSRKGTHAASVVLTSWWGDKRRRTCGGSLGDGGGTGSGRRQCLSKVPSGKCHQ